MVIRFRGGSAVRRSGGAGYAISFGGLALILAVLFVVPALPTGAAYASPLPACSVSSSGACLLGPNLEITNVTGALFSGAGATCEGGMNLYDPSPTNPGVSFTGGTCLPITASESGAVQLVALNGYEIEDVSSTGTCGVTAGNSLSLTVASAFTLTCPLESASGATGTASGETTFPPVTTYTLDISESSTSTGSGSISLPSWGFNVSLTPEPGSMGLVLSGLVGLAAMARRRFGRR